MRRLRRQALEVLELGAHPPVDRVPGYRRAKAVLNLAWSEAKRKSQ